MKSAPPVRADAIRLLTIHGAKGLEADTVFITDADPERPSTETTTLLVDWPVEAEHPLRCAFVYSESRCPPSLAELLAAEMRAREREEMNGLYVAMTRAKRRLVFSATEPFQPPPRASWWQRVQPFAAAVELEPVMAIATPRRDRLASLQVLPRRAPRLAGPPTEPQLSLPFAATESPRDKPASRSVLLEQESDDRTQALGRAIHRLLEWAGGAGVQAPIAELAAAAAAEFGADAALVERHGAAILRHPDCARFFTGPQILWSGNEVAVSDASEVLRIDRLVQLEDTAGPTWWVLDYKLHHGPEAIEPYRAQLRRYRAVIERAQPGAAVRCAFITGEGRVVELS